MGLVASTHEIHAKSQEKLPKTLIIVLGNLMHDNKARWTNEQKRYPNPERQQDKDPHATAKRLHGNAPDTCRPGGTFK